MIRVALIALAVSAAYVGLGLLSVQNSALRDSAMMFEVLMICPPIMFTAPIIAVLAGCMPLARSLRNRHLANTRTRADVRSTIGRALAGSAASGFVVFAVPAAACGLVAVVWPELQPQLFAYDVYGATPAERAADARAASTFSQLLTGGVGGYIVGFATWHGLCGAILATVGSLALLIVPQQLVALCVPFALYLLQSIATTLSGATHAALMYAMFPFGLTQIGMGEAITPYVVLLAMCVAAAVVVVRRAPGNGALS